MLKESSAIDQPQYGQEWFRELSIRAAHCQAHRFIICQVRPQSEITIMVLSRERVKNQESPHGLTWLKSKRLSDQGPCSTFRDHYLINIASSLKNCERPPFDLAVSFFHSLSGILGSPLLSLSSSRFISIFDIFWSILGPAVFFCPVERCSQHLGPSDGECTWWMALACSAMNGNMCCVALVPGLVVLAALYALSGPQIE